MQYCPQCGTGMRGRSRCPRGGYCETFRAEHEALVEKGGILTAEQLFVMTEKELRKYYGLREMREEGRILRGASEAA